MLNGGSDPDEFVEIGDLSLEGYTIGLRKRLGRLVVSPFLGGLVQRFVVPVKFLLQRFGWFLLAQLGLESVRD